MKKLLVIALLTISGIATAACPPYSPYGCKQGFNGKMICGCGVR
jgi:hypothetical protein